MERGSPYSHEAIFYRDRGELVAAAGRFVAAAVAEGEPVLVAVPGSSIDCLRAAAPGDADGVEFMDISSVARNPGRLLPTVTTWLREHGQQGRVFGETVWPGRSPREVIEAMRHEALLELAFADADVKLMCAYDGRLNGVVRSGVERTHRHLHDGQTRRPSDRYMDPLLALSASEWSLPSPPRSAVTYRIEVDLAPLRQAVRAYARDAGMDDARATDLVIAVNEACANALVHGRSPATLRIWRENDGVVCEVTSRGRLEDPLAGRRRPNPDCATGRGLWLINELCDLVELHAGERDTAVRLHMDVAGAARQVAA